MPTVACWASALPAAAKPAPAKAPAIKYRLPIMLYLLHLAAKR
jgi:hypothetical protein